MPLVLRSAYLALTAWQIIWFVLLPTPLGPRLAVLGLVAAAPLLLAMRTVMVLNRRGINWVSYLLIPYFLVGVMEAWSNPPQRMAAMVQITLTCACLAAIGLINRQRGRAQPRL